MSRGRPATIIQNDPLRKFTRVYEDEFTIETWTYNLDKFPNGPISVDIKYKPGGEKAFKQHVKQGKIDRRNARQMKKINERNKK